MKKTRLLKKSIIFILVFCFMLSGCLQQQQAVTQTQPKSSVIQAKQVTKTIPKETIGEDKEIYDNDDDVSITDMYLTVVPGEKETDTNHTWADINTYSAYDYEDMGVDRYKVKGILEIKKDGETVYASDVPNVKVNIRGQASSKSKQKSYKIKIDSDQELYNGTRTLNLNKHQHEPYRFINKLCYDLLEGIPQLMSGKTEFVNLYVKDMTEGGEEDFVDYGLYTMVEQVNKKYLKRRGLDENGHLYKVSLFEWTKVEAIMTPYDDDAFDMDRFEYFMEMKGDKDPTKLQDVIKKLNNYSIPIETIVDEHFDEENLAYWMAFNILIGNYDGASRNLFIYSPLNSEKFYMICWDMDAAFRTHYNQYRNYVNGISWECGISRYLGLVLVNRMMKEEKYRKQLEEAVEDLYKNYMTKDIVDEKVLHYKDITRSYLYGDTRDSAFAPIRNAADFDELVTRIGDEVDENYQIFLDSMKKPFPFFISEPIRSKDKVIFNWDTAYSYDGGDIKYTCMLADEPKFEEPIFEADDLIVPTFTIDKLPEGDYYLKVSATNADGYSMDCFDYYYHEGVKYYGCYHFRIDDKGKIKIDD